MTTMTLVRNEIPAAVATSSTDTHDATFYAYACKIGYLFFAIAMFPVGLAIMAADTIPLFHLYTQSAPYADINYCVSFAAVLAWAGIVGICLVQAYDYHKHG